MTDRKTISWRNDRKHNVLIIGQDDKGTSLELGGASTCTNIKTLVSAKIYFQFLTKLCHTQIHKILYKTPQITRY